MTLPTTTTLIMTILVTLNMGDITLNGITLLIYLKMTLLITVNKKQVSTVA